MADVILRRVPPEQLLAEMMVLGEGFAGHTINDFPEPTRTYYKIYYQMEPFFEQERKQRSIKPQLLVSSSELGPAREVLGLVCNIWGELPEHQVEARLTLLLIRHVSGDTWQSENKMSYLHGEQVRNCTILSDMVCLFSPLG